MSNIAQLEIIQHKPTSILLDLISTDNFVSTLYINTHNPYAYTTLFNIHQLILVNLITQFIKGTLAF